MTCQPAWPLVRARPAQDAPNSELTVSCNTFTPAGVASRIATSPTANTPAASLKSRRKASTIDAIAKPSAIRLIAILRPVSPAFLAADSSEPAFSPDGATAAMLGPASAAAATAGPTAGVAKARSRTASPLDARARNGFGLVSVFIVVSLVVWCGCVAGPRAVPAPACAALLVGVHLDRGYLPAPGV